MRFNQIFLYSALMAVSSFALRADILVNGSCSADCSSPSVSYGQSASTPFSFDYTVGSDVYLISGNYSASYDRRGTVFSTNLGASYVGSAPSVSNDQFTIDLKQSFFDNSPGSWDGTYTETIPLSLSGNVGTGSTVSAELFWDGQGLGKIGPYGPGTHTGSNSANLSGLTGDNLNGDFQFVYNFAAGTDPGAGGGTPVSNTPEPAMAIPAGLSLLLFAGVAYYRRGCRAV